MDIRDKLRAQHTEWLKTATPEEIEESQRPWRELKELEDKVAKLSGRSE